MEPAWFWGHLSQEQSYGKKIKIFRPLMLEKCLCLPKQGTDLTFSLMLSPLRLCFHSPLGYPDILQQQ